MTHSIELDSLTKRFGTTTALKDLSMVVPTGHIHGFLGPNGSGKSTTIRILLGLLQADAGTARILGGDAWADATTLHSLLAYVPGDVALWPNLSGGEAIDVLLRSRGSYDTVRRDELIEAFQLDPRKKCRTYSKGNRQKVALIAALAADVELLLLDEPTSGLDPLMERIFTDQLRADRDCGRTVLLSSHILSEVGALCDHVSIIKDGAIVESGTLDDLRHLHRTEVAITMADVGWLNHVDGVHDVRRAGQRVHLTVDDDVMPAVIVALFDNGATDLICTPPTLEELFLRHYDKAA